MEDGIYSLFVINKRIGESMSLREAYKALQALEDVLILVERGCDIK